MMTPFLTLSTPAPTPEAHTNVATCEAYSELSVCVCSDAAFPNSGVSCIDGDGGGRGGRDESKDGPGGSRDAVSGIVACIYGIIKCVQ